MAQKFITFLAIIFITLFSLSIHPCISIRVTNPIGKQGEWQLLRDNVGVVAMHMALTHMNTILIFDQTGTGPSAYLLSHRSHGGECHQNHANDLRDSSCFAHSVEYHIDTNSLRPLKIESDPFCSSGSFLSNGTLLQTGGYANGYKKIRQFEPCGDGRCDWRLSKAKLAKNRWYASNQLLPGEKERVIVVGGKNVFSYEFVPRKSSGLASYTLPFLHNTYNRSEGGNNLYPFLHLSSDGHLFIFANRDSILFNYRLDRVVKTYPRMPGGGSRSYPSSGSSVILPLDHRDGFQKVVVMICGGAAEGAYTAARGGQYLEGLKSCGRMEITGHKNKWFMEDMPHPRLLMDMVILPTGHVLLINGAQAGAGGWNNADRPAHNPFLYRPKKPLGKRFLVLQETNVARMYHSSAILLPDGRVLIGGSNPNERYVYHNVRYPTELKLQAFAPQYTDHRFHSVRPSNISIASRNQFHRGNNNFKESKSGKNQHLRPSNTSKKHSNIGVHHVSRPPSNTNLGGRIISTRPRSMSREKGHGFHPTKSRTSSINNNVYNGNETVNIRYGEKFHVTFWLGRKLNDKVEFNAYAPPFTTHSVSMNQRLLKLKSSKVLEDDGGWVDAVVEAPPSANVAPSGYYMLFLVNGGIPSTAQWIRFVHA
ncbi:aldehyde oxidase GLOX-like [Chenopodium quinoa]|uniref:aldehyde oxidase GLOX-like n=1 Tax=Chenopodium quinoa TaxID=63459 RepID=UPI000B76DD6B|nr:aldehyde oxidase GLOX-like [Chenopodium quinoa]